jgi:hypothetical protein
VNVGALLTPIVLAAVALTAALEFGVDPYGGPVLPVLFVAFFGSLGIILVWAGVFVAWLIRKRRNPRFAQPS